MRSKASLIMNMTTTSNLVYADLPRRFSNKVLCKELLLLLKMNLQLTEIILYQKQWDQHVFEAKATASTQQDASRDTRNLLESGFHPQFIIVVTWLHPVSRTDEGMNGWRVDAPAPLATKRLRASEKELLSRSLNPTPPLRKNPLPLNLFKKKKSQNSIFCVCVCVCLCVRVCICVCLSVSLIFFFFIPSLAPNVPA